jgi:hypothetical protein
MLKSQMKTTLITVLEMKGVVHFEFIPQVQAVNQAYYMGTMKRLCEAVHRKLPDRGPTFGFSAMTMLQLTWRSVSSSFWPKNL